MKYVKIILDKLKYSLKFRKISVNTNINLTKRKVFFSSWIYAATLELLSTTQALPDYKDDENIEGKTNKLKSNTSIITVKNFGAVGDGIRDDSPYLQAAVDFTEHELGSYICFPNYDETYLINSEIIVTEPGIKIFGFKGSTYNRGKKRRGNIILGDNASCAFNLGNFRLWNKQNKNSNPADSWSISNIGIVQKSDLKPRTKNGFMFSSKTNGPDRGVLISECSTSGLNSSVYIPNPEVPISLATLNIENCCFSGNNYSVFAEGRVCGARIIGNQMEQNALGAIHGALDGPVFIADNMLEGQPNAINITSHKNGNRLGVIIERNYFELNTGEYLIKIEMGSGTGVIVVKNNYDLNIKSRDFFVLTGGGAANVTLGKNLFEPRCVTFDNCVGTIKYGSRIFDDVNYYRVRRFITKLNRSAVVLISDYSNLNNINDHKNIKLSSKDLYKSPYGPLGCVSGARPISLDMSAQEFDVLGVSIYCYVSQKDHCTLQLFDIHNEIYMDGSTFEIDIYGKWCLINFAFYAQKNTKNLLLRFTYSKYIQIASLAIKNYGKHTNDGTDFKDIYPVMPDL